MYLDYYCLKFKPFEISPDPSFLWLGEKYKEALRLLEAGIRKDNNFMLLMGDPGTGKTTIVNALSKRLENDFVIARIFDPSLSETDFFNLTANELGIKKKFKSKDSFLLNFGDFLSTVHKNNKKLIIIIEEVQRIEINLLDQIYLLSNMGKLEKTLITTILVGQKEFTNVLLKNDAIRQRINLTFNMEPLREFEIEKYIEYRLKTAGSNNRIFDSKTTSPIFRYSNGIPRNINKICDLALLTGYKRNEKIIKPKLIKYCSENYDFNYNNRINKIKFNKFQIRIFALALSIIMIFVSGYFFYIKNESLFPVNNHAIYANVLRLVNGNKFESLLHKSNKTSIELRTPIDPILGIINFNVQVANENEISPLAESKNSHKEFDFILSENDNTKTRSAPINTAVTEKSQQMPQTNQELIEMGKTIERIKKENELLRSELISKDAMIEELQNLRDELKNVADNYVEEIEALKTQLLSKNLEQKTYPSLPSNSKIQERLTLENEEVIDNDLQPHDPNDIIDWVLQKKTE